MFFSCLWLNHPSKLHTLASDIFQKETKVNVDRIECILKFLPFTTIKSCDGRLFYLIGNSWLPGYVVTTTNRHFHMLLIWRSFLPLPATYRELWMYVIPSLSTLHGEQRFDLRNGNLVLRFTNYISGFSIWDGRLAGNSLYECLLNELSIRSYFGDCIAKLTYYPSYLIIVKYMSPSLDFNSRNMRPPDT